jgi:HEAT repeat protein
VLTWDVLNLNGEPPAAANLSPTELETLWADLGSADAARGYRAVRALVAAPDKTLPLLRRQLGPATAPDPKQLARLIADLDDDQFEVREKATRALEELGSLARPALRQALETKPSAEVRRRLDALLESLQQFRLTPPEEWRGGRAIDVLERIGTTEARELLDRLVRGGSDTSLLTLDARGALERLRQRTSAP